MCRAFSIFQLDKRHHQVYLLILGNDVLVVRVGTAREAFGVILTDQIVFTRV